MTVGLLAVPLSASAVSPLPANAHQASASTSGTTVVAESGEAPAIAAFVGSGYSSHDAEVLADGWGVGVQRATTAAGSRIKMIGVLPHVDPEPGADQGVEPDKAFAKAGYTPLDARVLADRWGLEQPGTGKADSRAAVLKAGQWLAQGHPLATYPLSEPKAAAGLTSSDLREVYGDAGCTPQQASVLADAWETSTLDAKARAGRELLTVGVLPFVDATA
ncbi:MAG: hypothetical protein ACFCVG_09630 [Kineosporiaceae bacterium]